MSDRRPRLREQVYRGVGWSVLQTWGSRLITFAVFLVLARLLGPNDFGVVTTAYVIVAALAGLVDLGVGDALVRRKDLVDSHYDSAFWVMLSAAFALYALLALSATAIGALFRQPTLPPLLWILGAMLPLTAASRVHEARLRSAMAFKPLAVRTLVASVVGGVVGIAMAFGGLGYWSLLAKGMAESATAAVVLWRASPYRPTARFDRAHWSELFRVGRPLLMSRLVDIVNQRLDSLIVSSRLGPAALGLYAAGQRIHQTLMEALFASINRVTLPAFAKLQDDTARMRNALLHVTALASFFTFPLFASIGVLSERLVLLLFGAPWLGSAPILSAFCAGGVLYSVMHFNTPLMVARGRTGFVLALMLVNTSVNAAGFVIGVHWGAVGVATAWSLRGYLVLPLNLTLLRRTIGMPARRYLAHLLPSLSVTLGIVACLVLFERQPWSRRDDLGQTLMLGFGAAVAYFATMLLVFPSRSALVAREIEALLPRAPKLARHIERYRDRLAAHRHRGD